MDPGDVSPWSDMENNAGWPTGIAFLTSLVTPAAMFGGIDSALHLSEGCTDPSRTVPCAVLATVGVGCVTAFAFSITMCYGIKDLAVLQVST